MTSSTTSPRADDCHIITNSCPMPASASYKKSSSVSSYFHLNITVMNGFSKFIAEVLGTAFLMFGGCIGCIKWDDQTPSFASAVTFGFVVMTIIQCYGHISGAHLNPAVTLAAIVFRSISIPMAILYFFAQLIGATIGYRFLITLTPTKVYNQSVGAYGFCQTAPHKDLSEIEVFVFEYIATMVLISVCCACWDPRNETKQDSIAIKFGFVIFVLSYIFGPYTGCSMNPIRTFAPAFWSEQYPMHWIYWIAPSLSALITSFGYKMLFMEKSEVNLEAVQSFQRCKIVFKPPVP